MPEPLTEASLTALDLDELLRLGETAEAATADLLDALIVHADRPGRAPVPALDLAHESTDNAARLITSALDTLDGLRSAAGMTL